MNSAHRNAPTADDPRWLAVLARDPAADSHFVYGVKTTGIYRRASSPSRLPRRENVEFFDTAQQAEAAGYRASKRAGGEQSELDTARVTQACQCIEQADSPPNLKQLAEQAGLSPFHFHRVFKAVTDRKSVV